jgi:hypothetical protein
LPTCQRRELLDAGTFKEVRHRRNSH